MFEAAIDDIGASKTRSSIPSSALPIFLSSKLLFPTELGIAGSQFEAISATGDRTGAKGESVLFCFPIRKQFIWAFGLKCTREDSLSLGICGSEDGKLPTTEFFELRVISPPIFPFPTLLGRKGEGGEIVADDLEDGSLSFACGRRSKYCSDSDDIRVTFDIAPRV